MLRKINLSRAAAFFKNVISEKNLNILRSFFMSKWYPIWVAFSVLIGRVTCLEVYFAMLDFILVSVALLVCDSIRPVLPNLITFLYRIPLEHSPGAPLYSTYYSETKLGAFWVLAAVFFVALALFYIKNKVFVGVNILKTPLFISLSLFSLSFLTAGMFSGNKMKEDWGFALLEIFVFFIVYLILYYGLRRENADELIGYFTYICAMCAIVLSLEVLDVFLRVEGAMSGGVINKDYVNFGWGISNTCGSALSVLAPICVLGAMRSKRFCAPYYAVATLAIVATYFTLARASVLVGTIGFVLCMIISCCAGKNKKGCRISAIVVVLLTALVLIVFKDLLSETFVHYSNKGFSDSGRRNIWEYFLNAFKEAPIFGNGFFYFTYGLKLSAFTPALAHNTFVQLLASMGVFGFAAYVFYRVCTFFPFLKHFTIEKFMLMISGGFLVFESLIDNFIFWFNPTFVYNICILLAIMHCEQAGAKKEEISDTSDTPNIGESSDIIDANTENLSLTSEIKK